MGPRVTRPGTPRARNRIARPAPPDLHLEAVLAFEVDGVGFAVGVGVEVGNIETAFDPAQRLDSLTKARSTGRPPTSASRDSPASLCSPPELREQRVARLLGVSR